LKEYNLKYRVFTKAACSTIAIFMVTATTRLSWHKSFWNGFS